ncbi:PREDICTED: puromycin-sensitive aminopeptidase [Trachymyrmex cornetzi]|uniref:Aminopeptidase n=1 Tax=Trachymyrmex cornetzi TaxID=471704 RepID=A0A195DLR4_9HYME|nr:PREDICTED: puromycin-sensitive aminopeptidase [Trachymyrmex cornetzi]KYN13786.1 Puromycin-sensitive aminopeptidase [Trachymyrmex cornetzi]
MFSRVVARVSVRCRLVSQQKEKGVGDNLLSRLLRASTVGVGNGGSQGARYCGKTCQVAVSEPCGAMSGDEKPFRRLPLCVRPYHYDIFLTPHITTFDGTEKVHLNVETPTDTIVLNCLEINIKRASFYGNDGKTIVPDKIVLSGLEETATLVFPEALPSGKSGYLNIEFVGEINNKMKGFYRSKYSGEDGTVEYAAVTQFEPTDARRCFPCWDEPALKATFDITLKVPIGLTALSNMPVKSKVTNGNCETLTFERTPIMSTYLVAVVVGDFDYIEDMSSDGVLVRVYVPKSKKEQGKFALEVATKVLPYYKTYFGIAYPLPKIDLIAIADFSSGAMENWGLVTYRETCLLVDPQNTSAVRKQWIALIVAHELAHQWFGNLVTMEWWTHLWLNEGYASFVEFLCVAHLFPEYDIWTQFVTDTYIRALELDALKNSHPIEVPVGHPSEIDEIFDDISYHKGASVIRMLHAYIGDDDFRKGMNLYLKRHSYANAETEDLWAALEEASNKAVRKVMSSWTKRQGFPVVKVDYRQEGNDRILSLSQERFLADGSVDNNADNAWLIPISVSSSQDPNKTIFDGILDAKTKEFVIQNVPEGTWLKINPGTIGFYRTRYSQPALSLLLPAIKDHTLPPLDRLGLLDDHFAMVQAGYASTVEVLELMQAFLHEDNYTVWSTIVNILSKIGILISHLDFEDSLKAFGRNLFREINVKLGWDPKQNESHLNTLLRSLVLGRMAALNDQDTIEEAKRRFELHVNGTTTLAADLRSPVYRAVLSVGDANTYDTMLKLYKEADLQEEKERILRALGAIKDETLLRKVLDFAMSEEVRAQDTVFAIMSVSLSYKGRLMAWNFFKEKWKTLLDRYEGGFLLARLVKFTTENFVTEEQAKDVESFFEGHPTPGTERTVQQCVESIRLNAAWLNREKDSIRKYLTTQV